jgi:hypothetical protein
MQDSATVVRQAAAGTESDLVRPAYLLRAEGIAVALVGIVLYARLDLTWWLFGGLIIAPDVSLLGLLFGKRIGALSYNLFHTYTAPAILAVIGFAAAEQVLQGIAVIWAVHIGVDRTIGYGLKYATAFKDTHLQRV